MGWQRNPATSIDDSMTEAPKKRMASECERCIAAYTGPDENRTLLDLSSVECSHASPAPSGGRDLPSPIEALLTQLEEVANSLTPTQYPAVDMPALLREARAALAAQQQEMEALTRDLHCCKDDRTILGERLVNREAQLRAVEARVKELEGELQDERNELRPTAEELTHREIERQWAAARATTDEALEKLADTVEQAASNYQDGTLEQVAVDLRALRRSPEGAK